MPTLSGSVTIKLPPNTSSGGTFRLRGKGLKDPKSGEYGDLYARTKIVLPSKPDADLEKFLEQWSPAQENPRATLKTGTG